jgi:hypothetical protein
MPDLEALRAIRARVIRDWIRLPGVLAVGIGGKVAGGRTTGEMALIVSVSRKRPLAEIPAAERIPSEVEGVKTDVVVRSRAMLLQATLIDEDTVRPIVGGTCVRVPQQELAGDVLDLGMGTAGFLAKTTDDGQIVFVTNHHVLHDLEVEGDGKNFIDPTLPPPTVPDPNASRPAKKKIGRRTGQPDMNNVSLCLPCCQHIVGNIYDSILSYQIDGAIVALATSVFPPTLNYQAAIHQIGGVTGERDLLLPEEKDNIKNASIVVQKRGIHSVYTRGYVTKVDDAPTAIDLGEQPFENVMEVVPCPPFLDFSLAGDSGSAVLDLNGKLVGLMFAGGGPAPGATAFTNACHVKYLKSQLKIDILTDTGSQPVPSENHSTVSPRPGDREPGFSALGATDAEADPVVPVDQAKVAALLSTSAGSSVWKAIERNQQEAASLVRRNARVAAAWRRYRGAAAARELLACLGNSKRVVTPRLGRFRWEDSVDGVLETMDRYASEELKADIRYCRPLLRALAGKSLDDVLSELRS